MGAMKDFDRRIRQGGDDAIAAVNEYVKELEGEVACARACAEMMLQGTGQKLGEELARRAMDEHYPPRWIPVEERLPEEGRLVLWYRPDERWPVTSGRFERPHHVNDGGDLCVPFSEGRYTHWMPLPEPPEVK